MFPVNKAALEADLVWDTPERAGRRLCGVAVRGSHEGPWRSLVDSL